MKTAVIAIGGNAIIMEGQKGTIEEQFENVSKSCDHIIDILEEGYNVVLTHYLVQTSFSTKDKVDVFNFVASSGYFSGPTWMALAKNAMDAAHNVEYRSILTTMARNGYEFGIRVSGLEGNQWFTGPAQVVVGPLFAGFKPEDSGLDIGDSAITETYGIGGFAMSTAPAIISLVGGTVNDAINYT
ncbi:DUF1116 domain-containing protein [Proteiniclasticum ruminis]|uniref:Carbamate kinase n=1 Tax=Proteiniclasticum ruminis TaxID=398199 RepID=A0A1G8QR31_9CLOT|nr:DUF1116 domain-containing protein [Proteiniclasticum ruminis]SDJ07123.1 Protein of unknown function [Proteiniclasticum ruminis]